MVSTDDLQEVVHALFKEPIIGPLKSKMAVEFRHLENRHDVIFFCRGWFDLDKISQTGAERHVDCGDMVEIETRCIQFQYIADVWANSMTCHPTVNCHIAWRFGLVVTRWPRST